MVFIEQNIIFTTHKPTIKKTDETTQNTDRIIIVEANTMNPKRLNETRKESLKIKPWIQVSCKWH